MCSSACSLRKCCSKSVTSGTDRPINTTSISTQWFKSNENHSFPKCFSYMGFWGPRYRHLVALEKNARNIIFSFGNLDRNHRCSSLGRDASHHGRVKVMEHQLRRIVAARSVHESSDLDWLWESHSLDNQLQRFYEEVLMNIEIASAVFESLLLENSSLMVGNVSHDEAIKLSHTYYASRWNYEMPLRNVIYRKIFQNLYASWREGVDFENSSPVSQG